MQMRMVVIKWHEVLRCLAFPGLACVALGSFGVEAQSLNPALEAQLAAQSESAAGQQRIDALDDAARAAAAEYRSLLQEADGLTRYADALEKQVAAQADTLASLDADLANIEETARAVLPLMARMVDTFDAVIAADLPFLIPERSNRHDALVALMDRSDVTVAEKYRRILEAYQVELEFGRTLEAYQARLPFDDDRQVEFLRVGRLALLYRTLDGSETGYWSPAERRYVVDNGFRVAVQQGLRIARQQVAPDWLEIPVTVSAGAVR